MTPSASVIAHALSRRARPVLALGLCGLGLAGCFKPTEDLAKLDFTEMPYDNALLDSDTAVLRAYDIDGITCPDGEPGRIYAAYDPSFSGAVPGVLLLHSGAFDFIIEPDESDVLGGVHYRASSRLERPWALAKVWETVGMNPRPVDPEEESVGALPATLVSQGAVVVMPANCWGDLWHAEGGDMALEGFERNGLGLAKVAHQALRDGAFAGSVGLDIPLEIDQDSIHLVGLGSGARGIAELAIDPANDVASVASVVVDSAPDRLSAYQGDLLTFEDELLGFETIYGAEAMESIDSISLGAALVEGTLPPAVGVLWSDLDVDVPTGAIRPTAADVSDPGFARNTGTVGTVFSNSDPTVAAELVAWMIDGTVPGE